MISLITPSFNSSQYIEDTYQSILRQTNRDWEWIIVDDGSTDNTIELLKKYAASDNRIRFFQRDRLPKGATTCRNIAVEKSNGEYLLFIDTDDLLAPFCLEQRQAALAQCPSCAFAVFQMILFNEKPDDLRLLWNVEDGSDNLERAIRMNPVMAGSSTLWRKAPFVQIGMWDDQILINQDIELHVRAMANALPFQLYLNLPPDLYVRNNQQSISRARRKPKAKQLSRVYYFKKIREHLQQNGLFDKHRAAVNWLLIKLLLDILKDGETAIASQLAVENKDLIKSLPLKLKAPVKLLLNSGKLGRVLIGVMRRMNNLLSSKPSQTFGKQHYDGPIFTGA